MIKLIGELIELKSVSKEDTTFILKLRGKKELNEFISPTSASLEEQEKWIERYLEREKENKEFYFIVQDKKEISCGTVRLYNIDKENKEGTWGSFILDENRPNGASYEVIDLSLKYAFETLKLKKVFLDVRKENKKAIHIYEKVGFKKCGEDKLNFYYEKEKI